MFSSVVNMKSIFNVVKCGRRLIGKFVGSQLKVEHENQGMDFFFEKN